MNANRKGRAKPRIGRRTQCHKALDGKNNKISGKRLTLPPGFLTSGIASKTVKKDIKEVANTNRERVLREDLHSFFQHNMKKLRRSERILEKRGNKGFKGGGAVCGEILGTYTNKLDVTKGTDCTSASRINSVELLNNEHNNDFNFSKCISPYQGTEINLLPENKSKSVFNEINQRYEQIGTTAHEVRNTYSTHHLGNSLANYSFCDDLRRQICNQLVFPNVENECIENIFREIESANLALQGKQQVRDIYTSDKKPPDIDISNDDDEITHYRRIPRARWIFSTPPNRNIDSPLPLKSCRLQPAVVLGNRDNQCNIYEINPNFNVELITPNVPHDERFVNQVKWFRKTPVNFNFGARYFKLPVQPDGKGYVNDPTKQFNLFSTRPSVAGLEEPSSTCNPVFDNERHDFTFVEDGDGYRMKETQSSTTNHFTNFDPKGHNNLFDFSNMKTNK